MDRKLRRAVTGFSLIFLTLLGPIGGSSASDNALVHEHDIISREITVQTGETLTSIATREFGKASFSALLAEYNNIAITENIKPGLVLRIPIHVPPRGEYAEVVFVKGKVTVTRKTYSGPQATPGTTTVGGTGSKIVSITEPGEKLMIIPLGRNDQIFSGDKITTTEGGYLSIAFSSGSVINLQPETIATLETLTCLESDSTCQIEINTLQGQVTSNVESRDQQPTDFRITTPYASAAVRGTVFDLSASENLLVGVTEGNVDIIAQDKNVPLDVGYGVAVAEGEAPGEPVELIPSPVFMRVPARFTEGDTLEWWSFNDASAYLALLSNDETGNEVLTDFRVPDDSSVLDVASSINDFVDPGDYFLTIRAIDRQGLMGFPSNTRITLAEIDPAVDPVNTQVVREGSEYLVTVEDGPDIALGYEIQISSDESFSDPLSVDVNENGTAIFRIDEDEVFTRARVLIDPYTVSAFGEPSGI